MEHDFWHKKWESGEIGFHTASANPLLVSNFAALGLKEGARVFLPLCGKTLDIHWLLDQGYRVAGAELSELAVGELFAELGVEPEVATVGPLKHYSATDIDIFVGDIFGLTPDILGRVDAVYDRAALVALPEILRDRYAAHLVEITAAAPQLLICFDYDQSQLAGPPFSVCEVEAMRHYDGIYEMALLAREGVEGGLKGKCPAWEHVWLLEKKR